MESFGTAAHKKISIYKGGLFCFVVCRCNRGSFLLKCYMPRASVAALTLLVILVFGFGVWMLFHAPPPAAVLAKPKLPPTSYAVRKDGVVKVPSDFAWDQLTKDELKEFAGLFPKNQNQNNFSIDTTVSSGESIVTAVYEGGGEFAVTELKPVIKRNADGDAYVEMGVLTKGIGTSGDQRVIASKNLKLPIRGSYTLGAPVVYGEDNKITGYYTIDVRAKIQDGTSSIAVLAAGKYESAADNQKKPELID